MRKSIICFLLLICSLSLCLTAYAEPLWASNGQTGYKLDQNTLFTFNERLDSQEMLFAIEESENAEAFFAGDSAFYILQRIGSNVQLISYTEQERKLCFTLPADAPVRDMIIRDQDVFLLQESNLNEQIAEYNIPSGLLSRYDFNGNLLNENICMATDIALDADHAVWIAEVIHHDAMRISKWEDDRQNCTAVLDANAISAICATPNGFAFINIDGLHLYDPASGNTHWMERIEPWENAALLFAGEQLIVYQRSTGEIHEAFRIDDSSSAQTVLTLINCESYADIRMERAVELLKKAHPEVVVQFTEMDLAQLNTALLAREDGLDILLLDAFDVPNYVANQAVTDLFTCPDILEQLDQWIPCTDAVTYDGVLYGVPWNIWANAFYINDSFISSLPSSLNPLQMSWKELMTAGAQFCGDINGDGIQDIGLWKDSRRLPVWLFQYINSYPTLNDVTFDTEEFRDMLALYHQCVQNGSVLDSFESALPAIFSQEYLYGITTDLICPLPSLNCGQVITSDIKVFSINSTSRNQQLAEELLTYYASPEVQALYCHGESDEFLERHFIFSPLQDTSAHSLYGELTGSERVTVEANREYLSRSVFTWMYAEFNRYAGDQIESYLADEISLDELIHNVDGKFQMILWG